MQKKSFLLIPLFAFLAISFVNPLNKENKLSSALEEEIVEDLDWHTYAGKQKNVIGQNDETYFLDLKSSGQYGYYKYKVHFDGIDVTLRADHLPEKSTCFGFYFTKDGSDKYSAPFFSLWKELYSNQTRVHVGDSHDYNDPLLLYSTPDLASTKKFGGNCTAMAMYSSTSLDHAGFRVKINSYNSNWFKCVFSSVYDDAAIHTAHNSLSYDSSSKTCTMYLYKNDLTVLDSNGDCYLNYMGFDTNATPSGAIPYIKFMDNNRKAYQDKEFPAIEALLSDYVNTMKSCSSVEEFKSALASREEFINSLSSLRYHDQYTFSHDRLYEADASVSEVTGKYADLTIQEYADDANSVLTSMVNDESTIDENNLKMYNDKIEALHEAYDLYKNLMSSNKSSEIASLIDTLNYKVNYLMSAQWAYKFETMIANALSGDVGLNLDNALSYYEEDSAREYISNLNNEDMAAMNKRIADSKSALDNLVSKNKDKMAASYLNELQRLLSSDLGAATDYYRYINNRITFDASLGNAYNTFISLQTQMFDSCEKYIFNQLSLIEETFVENIEFLDEYEEIKRVFNAFDFNRYFFEESTDSGKLKTRYDEIRNLITSNPLYYFENVGEVKVDAVQNGKNGVYFESIGRYPARLNFNQALSISKGINIEIVVEEYAFYNDGTKANNISFNFVNENNSYKGCEGFSFVMWVYEKNSNIKLYNLVDGEIAATSISTPAPGESIHLSLTAKEEDGEYNYYIGINESTIVVSHKLMSQCGIEINDTTYFSIGTFLDDTTYPNSFSIKKINDLDFSKPVEKLEPNHNAFIEVVKTIARNVTNFANENKTAVILSIVGLCSIISLLIVLGLRRKEVR